MAKFAIQFGNTIVGKVYKERPSVYGICQGEGTKIAIAKIVDNKRGFIYDLPGGGVEIEESEPEGLMREFEEEVGINIWPIRFLGRAGQYWVNQHDVHYNSLASFYEVEITGEIGKPLEEGHQLIWMDSHEAMKKVRHESHSWAIMSWERARYKEDNY